MSHYLTLEEEGIAEFTERRSRFIGHGRPVKTEKEALDFIEEIRTKHWKATHNVYAYVLREGGLRRYSDDGEPQGTAGIPTLEVLTKSGLTDAVVVVTRYFGGIMLGAGGLVRAYSQGAKIAVDAGGIVEMGLCQEGKLTCDYPRYGRVAALVPEENGVVDEVVFTDRVELSFHMPVEDVAGFEQKLADFTCGEVKSVKKGEKFYKLKK